MDYKAVLALLFRSIQRLGVGSFLFGALRDDFPTS